MTVIEKFALTPFYSLTKIIQMFDISVNFKDIKNVDHTLKSYKQAYGTLFVILSNIGNQRRFSSCLSMPMFTGTPRVLALIENKAQNISMSTGTPLTENIAQNIPMFTGTPLTENITQNITVNLPSS